MGGTGPPPTPPCHIQHSPGTPTTGLRERGNDTSRSTGRSGRQNAATRRNMRRDDRVTVQGPVKEQQHDGMSHGGGLDPPPLPPPTPLFKGALPPTPSMARLPTPPRPLDPPPPVLSAYSDDFDDDAEAAGSTAATASPLPAPAASPPSEGRRPSPAPSAASPAAAQGPLDGVGDALGAAGGGDAGDADAGAGAVSSAVCVAAGEGVVYVGHEDGCVWEWDMDTYAAKVRPVSLPHGAFRTTQHRSGGGGRGRGLEGKGPRRRPQGRLGRRLEGVRRSGWGAVTVGYKCRSKLALGVGGAVAGRRLGALEGSAPARGGWGWG